MPSPVPISPERLWASIVDACPPSTRCVLGVDAADAARPVEFARRVAELSRHRGRSAEVIDLHDYVRPASIRFEYSRTDELSYRTLWFDFDALDREVIRPLRPGGSGMFLPRLWDERTDRSARVPSMLAAPDQLVIVAGPMLIGRGLEFGIEIELTMSEGALRRRTATEQHWTIPALLDHRSTVEQRPEFRVRWDHPERPALELRA